MVDANPDVSKKEESNAADATLFIASDKIAFESALHRLIMDACQSSIRARGVFCMALSGGSVPSFLSTLYQSFQKLCIDPQFDKWHICLADERIVPSDSSDCNLRAIQNALKEWSSKIQFYGIDETLLSQQHQGDDDNRIASSYEENVIKPLLVQANGTLDCIVLGFGPDGHTCSLFPNHNSLSVMDERVVAVSDSPKPPPRRITLTFPVINSAKCIIMCGAGSSKKDIVRSCFQQPVMVSSSTAATDLNRDGNSLLVGQVCLIDPAPYPCAMVRSSEDSDIICSSSSVNTTVLSWILDLEATQDLKISRL